MSASNWILAARVESLGDDATSATVKQYRWATGTPTGGTASWRSLYLPHMVGGLPSEISTSIDFRAGTGTIGALNFELANVDAVSQRFYRHRVDKLGNLAQDEDETGSAWQIEDNSGAAVTTISVGTTLNIGRECVEVALNSGGGNYTVVRGTLGTLKVSHSGTANPTADFEIFNADHGNALMDRVVVLLRVPASGGESDEEVLFRGVISGISDNGSTIRISTRTVVELLQRRQLCTKLFQVPLEATGRGAQVSLAGAFMVNPAHEGTDASGDRFLPLSIDGKYACLNKYDAGATDTPRRIEIHGTQGAQTRAFDGSTFPGIDEDDWKTGLATEFFTLSPNAPSLDSAGLVFLGADTDTTSNGFTLLLQCLLTTPTGDNSPYAAYDLGDVSTDRVFDNIGLAIPADLVDVDAIRTVRNRTPGRMESLHMGEDGKPIEDFYSWANQKICRPFGCVLTVGEGFKLTVVKLESTPRADTPALTEVDFVGIPTGTRRMDTVFDNVAAEYNNQVGPGPRRENFTDAINRQRLVSGRHKEQKLDCSGIKDRPLVVNQISSLVQRFHHPLAQIRFTLLNTLSYWPGQLLTITHSKLIGADGTRGVTAGTFLVVGRRQSLQEAVIHYDAIYVGAIFGRQGLLSGSLKMNGAAAALVHTVHPNDATGTIGTNDAIQTDTEAFAAGDFVKLLDRDWGPATDTTAREIDTVDSSVQITMVSAWSPAAADGQLIVPANYDDTVAAQKALWTWLADTSDTLGAAGDDAYEWDL